MDTGLLIEKIVLIVLLFAVSLGVAAYLTLLERKVAAWMQDRIGPDRAGKWGLLQPLADGGKLFFKEDFIPANADRFLFIIGPGLAMGFAMMTSAVIPWGPNIQAFGRDIALQVADVNIGILYIMALSSVAVYGIMIGGWASNNKFSLMAALRGASQAISYELAMGLSIISILMMTGSLSTKAIVEAQQNGHWNILYQPVGFILFIICAFAECNRTPFDLPECETELIGGYHTEYSSMKLGFYLFAEYANMFISSTIISVLFFGGYNYPGMSWVVENVGVNIGNIIGIIVLFAKICGFIFFYMWIRWTIPRFRYDQLMHLGWRILIPLSIINIMITGIVILRSDIAAYLGF